MACLPLLEERACSLDRNKTGNSFFHTVYCMMIVMTQQTAYTG